MTAVVGIVCAVGVSVAMGRLGGTSGSPLLAAGRFTEVALPAARFVALLCATGTIGVLTLRLLILRPDPAGILTQAGRHWAWTWALTQLAWMLLTVSDISGLPVWTVPQRLWMLSGLLSADLVRAQLSAFVLACAVAAVARSTSTPVLRCAAALACTALILPLLSSHVGHDQRGSALAAVSVHVIAASVWTGCLLALVVHLRGRTELVVGSVSRLSRLSLVCAVLVVASGLTTAAAAQISITDLETPYGRLLLVKGALFAVLVGVGAWHRTSTVPAALAGSTHAFMRVVVVELAVMGATFGVAASLTTAPPPWV